MKSTKKIVSLVLAAVLLLSVFIISPISASATASHTQAEAVAWVNSKIGTWVGSGQCVALIRAYADYLGLSVSGGTTGNACEYASVRNISDTERINNYNGFVPQPGDICVWGSNAYLHSGYKLTAAGHIGIVISADASNMNTVECNLDAPYEGGVCKKVSNYRPTNNVTCFIRPHFKSEIIDTQNPVVTNARAENISGNSFTIKCTLSDNIGVTRVWLVIYGPSGEKQYGVSATNGEFSHIIKTFDHGGEGNYTIHIYAFDASEKSAKVVIGNIKAFNDSQKPTITNARAENISRNSFEIKCTISDNIGVVKGWVVVYGPNGEKQYGISATNGEFSHTIKTADHGGQGTYTVHLYVYDTIGNSDKAVISDIKTLNDTDKPTITNARAENISGNSFDIKCKITDNIGVTRGWVVVYGPSGEKQYGITASNGEFSHTIKTLDHGGKGTYTVHLYVYDSDGNSDKAVISNIKALDDTEAPIISNARAENISEDAFDIKCTIYDNVGVTKGWVVVYGPSGEKQYGITAANGEFSHTIKTSDHGGKGIYTVHLYVYDSDENSDKSVISNIKATSEIIEPIETQPVTDKPTEPTETEPVIDKPTEPTGTQSVTDKPTEPTETQPVTDAPTEPTTDKATEPTQHVEKKDISDWEVIGLVNKVYNGKAITQKVAVTNGTDYATFDISYKNNVNVGNATVIIKGKGNYTGTIVETFKITKAKNPITVETATKTVKLSNVKRTKQTVKPITVSKAQGNVTYKLKSVPKALGKLVKISSKGAITISKWKKAKSGSYKIKVVISAKGNDNYKSQSVNKTVTIKIK